MLEAFGASRISFDLRLFDGIYRWWIQHGWQEIFEITVSVAYKRETNSKWTLNGPRFRTTPLHKMTKRYLECTRELRLNRRRLVASRRVLRRPLARACVCAHGIWKYTYHVCSNIRTIYYDPSNFEFSLAQIAGDRYREAPLAPRADDDIGIKRSLLRTSRVRAMSSRKRTTNDFVSRNNASIYGDLEKRLKRDAVSLLPKVHNRVFN